MLPLYGRADALKRASEALEQAVRGQGSVLLFTGEPGIGKSSLAEHVAADAQGHGWAVAWGRCWEAGGAPAYWPWRQIFRSLGMQEDPFAEAGPGWALGAAEVRFAAYERAVRALEASARRQPLLLVLDDLHAADAPSLLLLLLLARELSRVPLLVLGAYRDAELRLSPELAALLAKVAREAQVFPLSRLSPEDVAAWLNASVAESIAARASALYRLTEGHPLLVVEALRLRDPGGGVAAWPEQPSAVLDERLAMLGPEARAVLDVAAVLGREFSSADVAATGEMTPDRVAAALRSALGASIVVPGGADEVYRFSHVLLRDRLYRDLLPSLRATLHVRAGRVQLARGADPQAAAHHLFEGQSAARPEHIAEVAVAAAEAGLSRLAFEDAASLARRALALNAARPLPDQLQSQLQLVLAESLIRLGEIAEGKQLSLRAAELAERAGDPLLLARAALVYGTELMSGMLDEQMIALLRRALVRLGAEDSPLRARVMARLAAALTPPRSYDDGPEIVQLLRGARLMARGLGDRHALLYVLQFGATVSLLVPEEERFSSILETLELARALGQRLVLLITLPVYVTASLARGELERALAALPEYDQLLEAFPQPLHQLRRRLVGALLALFEGDLQAAEQASAEAHSLAQRTGSSAGWMLWLTHRLCFAQMLAKPELLGARASDWMDHFGAKLGAAPYVSWLLAALGRRAEALERLQHLPPERLDIPSANLMDLMGAAEAFVLLGEAPRAMELYPRLLRSADRMFWNLGPGAILGPTARTLGDLARLAGRTAEAVAHYDRAIAFCERTGAPALLELCREGRRAALAEVGPVPNPRGAPASAPIPRAGLALQREGDFWTLSSTSGALVRLRHSKGVAYLQVLLEQPGRQVHVLELAGIDHPAGDAGAVLDARAKAEYRARLDELRAELAEAERFGDVARAERSSAEIEALTEQLAGAVGLGGRDRRAASGVERTRINVQRRLKDVVDRVGAADPALGRQLRAALETGTYCVYEPL